MGHKYEIHFAGNAGAVIALNIENKYALPFLSGRSKRWSTGKLRHASSHRDNQHRREADYQHRFDEEASDLKVGQHLWMLH
jgi:hypothetical protein